MQTFKLKQDAFKEIRKQMLTRTVPILILAAAGAITISTLNSKDNDLSTLPFIIPIITLALGFGIYRAAKRQQALSDSYTLTITNNLITREQASTPTISIYFNEVKEITRYKSGSFVIKGKELTDIINIPSQMENYMQLETTLQNIKPITVRGKLSFFERYKSFMALITIGLMICVYTVNNKIIVAITGTSLIASLIWSFIKIQKSKNVDKRIKRGMWWIIVVLASIIVVMITKLSGSANAQ